MSRVAVVTGASSGIGEATARALSGRGWLCVLVARREDRLRRLAGEIGGDAMPCDLGERAAVAALAEAVLERYPAIGLLVNNAGIPARGTFLEAEPDEVERVLEVNFLAGVGLTRGLLPALRAGAREGGAHVVDVASVAGTVAFARSGPYAASKHAQVAYSRALGVSLRGSGIRVHTILPGFVHTEGFPQDRILANPRLRRYVAQPETVADAIVRAVERKRAEVVVPWFPYRLGPALQGIAPGLMARLAALDVGRSGKLEPRTGAGPERLQQRVTSRSSPGS